MAFDGTLKFDTEIDKSGFNSGLDSLGSVAKKGITAVTAAVGAASAAVTALGGYAVGVGKDFEGSMAQVIATMGITKDTVEDGVNSYDLLKEAAANAGESTTFSASEAADALNYLALAGYDAATASDALPAVLDLAAAGGLDLAYASDLATDAMAALGIEANSDNLTRFGDEMAKTASKANTSVAQLGEAILTVGGTAKSLAGGTTELNAALGVLANRGIKGAEGGTALRNMILALSAPTDKAAEAMSGLGLEVFDAAGNMRPMNEIFKDLDSALSGMSEGEKTQVLNEIFNKVDLKSAQAMLAGCGDEFDDLTDALEGCDGAMSQMADTMNDTLEGDMKSLSSKAEAFGISVYEGLNAPLRDLASKGGEYISKLNDAFKKGGFSGLAEALGPVAADALTTTLSGYIPSIVETGVSLVQSLIEGISENSEQIIESGMSVLNELIVGITGSLPLIAETGIKILSSLADSVSANLPFILTAALEMLTALVQGIMDNLPLLLEAVLGIITSVVAWISENLGMLIDAAVGIISALVDFIIDNLPMLIDACIEIIVQLVQGLIQNLPKILEAGYEILLKLIEGLIGAIPQLIAAIPQVVAAILDTIIETDWLSVGKNILLGIADGLVKGISSILDTIADVCESIWDSFCDFFGIHSPSTLFRDELGKFMLPGMVIGVESTEDAAADDINSSLADIENQLKPIVLPEPEIPEIPAIGVKLAKPEIPQIDADIPKPDINSVSVYIPDTEDDFPERRPPKPERDAIEEISVISFDTESLRALENARLTMNAGASQPSPTSEITNNYSCSTVSRSPDATGSQTVTIPISLVMDGKIIADGVADIVLGEVDEQQGIAVQMKKRGVAR